MIGVLAPSRTPRAVIVRVADAISAAVQHAEVRSRFNALGIDAVGSTPEAYARQIREDIAKYAKVVKAAVVRADQ